MDIAVKTLDGSAAGNVSVSDSVFGLEVRSDILQRMVRYQLSKRQAGTHNAKTRSELGATGKKFVRQKGSGGARHGDRKAPQFRGGGKAFGPVVRSHAHDLPKKVRALALKHALSSKVAAEKLIVLDDVKVGEGKTKAVKEVLGNLGLSNALVIGGAELDQNFLFGSRNIPNIDVLPVQGINVYDILRRDVLVLSKSAVEALEERFQ